MSTIADVKKYWNKRPCNIRHSTKPVGSREYFDDVEKRKYFVEPHIPGFAEFLVELGIDSISLNPDSVLSVIERVASVEKS